MKKKIAWILLFFVLAGGVFIAFSFKKINERYPWLLSYGLDQLRHEGRSPVQVPRHVMFLFTDHFEPHEQATMDRWVKVYPEIASRHRDADGKMPQHSWFWYFAHSADEEKKSFLRQLARLSYQGLGEIELHLHHAFDTETTFLEKMKEMIQFSQEVGAMITWEERPQVAFGFIHGLWGLDNSRSEGACGITNELILLRRLGCYADFTHPSWGAMHPKMVNRLYYAIDDPQKSKSYDTGISMDMNRPALGDLLIFEGPSVVRFNSPRPTYDHGDVSQVDLPTPERIDGWVRAGIHVKGRAEWIFVKVFAHGALQEDHVAVLGEWGDKMYDYLEKNYNDGTRYVLHYVTAREAYNIAKAAEAGKSGNPNDYRNFLIPPYVNRFLHASVPYEIFSAKGDQVALRFLVPAGTTVEMRIRALDVKVSGDVTVVSSQAKENETVLILKTSKTGVVSFVYNKTVITRTAANGGWTKAGAPRPALNRNPLTVPSKEGTKQSNGIASSLGGSQ